MTVAAVRVEGDVSHHAGVWRCVFDSLNGFGDQTVRIVSFVARSSFQRLVHLRKDDNLVDAEVVNTFYFADQTIKRPASLTGHRRNWNVFGICV